MIRMKLFTLCILLGNAYLFHAQTHLVQVKPVGSKLWGYATPSGEMAIPAHYEKCYPFSSGGVAVIYDSKARQHRIIDVKNEPVKTEQAFKIRDAFGINVSNFQNDLLLVQVNGKHGYMNPAGKMAIPAIYDGGNDFSGGFAAVKKGANYVILDTKGKETPLSVAVLDVRDFSEGLAPVKTTDKKIGFVNPKGEMVIPAQFENTGYFSNGLAWVKTVDRKYGFIDKTGKWVLEPQFEMAKDFDAKSGLARVKKGEKWCYVNAKGEVLDVDDTTVWGDFSEGLAEGKKGVLKGFYDNKGKWVIEPQFEDNRDFHNGYAAAKKDGKWGLIDKSGKWVIEPQYDAIKDVSFVK
ncbi:KWG Leptospira [compost metagenome]